MNDVLHGAHQSARSADFNEQGLVFAAFGLCNGTANVLIGDGMDRVVNDNFQNFS